VTRGWPDEASGAWLLELRSTCYRSGSPPTGPRSATCTGARPRRGPQWPAWPPAPLPLSFRFHVAMAGALDIGGDLGKWDPSELAEAARLIAAYKQIRPVVQRGRLYRIASLAADPVGASQYLAADGSEVVVLCWWEPDQCGPRLFRLRLAGLDPGARYTDQDTGSEHFGAALMNVGLDRPGGSDFGSALIRLSRTDLA
jgi:alpha-galactosidase